MKKNIYILTQVVDRITSVDVFKSKKEAVDTMHELFAAVLDNEGLTEEDKDHYEMSSGCAWINGYHGNEYDWAIVKKEVAI